MNDEKNIKTEAQELKEKLFIKRKNGVLGLNDDEINKIDSFCQEYKDFLNKAKTEREFVTVALKMAQKKGFKEYNFKNKYFPGDKVYYNNRDKSLVLAVIGIDGCNNGVKIAAAHIDSPRLDLKPNPLYEAYDLAFFKTHYYGGIKKYQWTAIPLSLHGKIIKKDGTGITVSIGENDNEPCFCVTDLLPHLAKEQMQKPMVKSFTGEDLNILVGSRPFKDDKEAELVKLNILKLLNEKYDITEHDFLTAELEMVPKFKACDVGFDKSMIGAYGHDDRVCAYTALISILNCHNPKNTAITVLADKEEVGSDGNTGMQSLFLKHFIADLSHMDNIPTRHVLRKSKCLSADVNAAFDPNYSSVHEPLNNSFLNRGVVITKYMGCGGKYDASDASAEFMWKITSMLNNNNIIWQSGELGKVDAGGGGTVAKYIANLNVDVVDLGVPVLSMHSPFEVVSKIDVFMAYRAFLSFLQNSI